MTDAEKLVREVLDITAPTAAPPSNLRGILYLGSILAERGWYKRAEAALAAQQDGAVSLSAEEAYILFLIVDTEARWLKGQNEATNALREKLRPAYSEWHRAHPFEVHPHTTQVCEQMQQLRRPEQ